MSERRRNALSGDWVIVSPGRAKRPWQGQEETPHAPSPNHWQHDCYLCPRNTRAHGDVNPDYRGTFAFDNDFPALQGTSSAIRKMDPLFDVEPITGECRVLCYSERHDATLATLDAREIRDVIDMWHREAQRLGARYPWVQLFENKGELMGASSPHPHGQAWATSVVPTLVQREEDHQRAYATNGDVLLVDYAQRELAAAERLVVRTQRWLAVVPWWAAWPFETLILPVQHRSSFDELDARDADDLAETLSRLLSAYDRLFNVSFPYSMGWHGRGRDQGRHWQLHAHVYPPLLRSATVRKFMVGFEMLAEAQRDLTAEEAAARLRSLVRT